MSREIAKELRLLRRENARLNRLLETSRLSGKVLEVKEEKDDWRVKLDLVLDPATGKTVESPWVRVQPASAGGLKIKVKPTVGEQMYLHSASGKVGADSVAIWGTFTDDHPAPKGTEDVVIERDKTRIALTDKAFEAVQDGVRVRLADGKGTLSSGGSSLEVADDVIRLKAKKIIAEGEVYLGDEKADLKAAREDLSPAEKVYVR